MERTVNLGQPHLNPSKTNRGSKEIQTSKANLRKMVSRSKTPQVRVSRNRGSLRRTHNPVKASKPSSLGNKVNLLAQTNQARGNRLNLKMVNPSKDRDNLSRVNPTPTVMAGRIPATHPVSPSRDRVSQRRVKAISRGIRRRTQVVLKANPTSRVKAMVGGKRAIKQPNLYPANRVRCLRVKPR